MSISDTRINELLTLAANRLGLDVETCPPEKLKKIPVLLKIWGSARSVNFTNEELEAVRKELAWIN